MTGRPLSAWGTDELSFSLMLWIGLAILPFWAVGAYNRLVRLRSQGLTAFANLEQVLSQLATLARHGAAGSDALAAAAEQFQASLKVSRTQALNGPTMSALKTAFETLCVCWDRQCEVSFDEAAAIAREALQRQWDPLVVQTDRARSEFKVAVENYNVAIGQFPAVLVAWVFGFRAAKPM